MKCPACRAPMYAVEFQRIELDCCGECQGLWFDADELALLVGREPELAPPDRELDEADRSCPRCRKRMRKANIGPERGVVIDVCPDGCGLWFDAGEAPALCRDLEAAGWPVEPAVRGFLSEMFPETPSDG